MLAVLYTVIFGGGEMMGNLFLDKTIICTDCGQEVERGIRNVSHHAIYDCKNNAPNENIESHHFAVESEHRLRQIKNVDFAKYGFIFSKLTADEQQSWMLMYYSSNIGTREGRNERNEKFIQFKQSMVLKYSA